MSEEERPAHYVYNFETGESERVEVSDEEWEQIKQGEREHEIRMQAQQKEEEELRESVRNHEDPVVKALGRKLGLV